MSTRSIGASGVTPEACVPHDTHPRPLAGTSGADTHPRRAARYGRNREYLTPTETRLVELLLEHAGQVVRHAAIVDHFWGHYANGGPDDAANAVKVLVCHTRQALANLGAAGAIVNDWGRGYVVPASEAAAVEAALARSDAERIRRRAPSLHAGATT